MHHLDVAQPLADAQFCQSLARASLIGTACEQARERTPDEFLRFVTVDLARGAPAYECEAKLRIAGPYQAGRGFDQSAVLRLAAPQPVDLGQLLRGSDRIEYERTGVRHAGRCGTLVWNEVAAQHDAATAARGPAVDEVVGRFAGKRSLQRRLYIEPRTVAQGEGVEPQRSLIRRALHAPAPRFRAMRVDHAPGCVHKPDQHRQLARKFGQAEVRAPAVGAR